MNERLQMIANIFNSNQSEIKFTVKKDRLVYSIDNVIYTCSLEEVKEMFEKVERKKL